MGHSWCGELHDRDFSLISIRMIKEQRWASYRDALLAIGVGGGLVYMLVIFGVIVVEPWYEPKYAISLSGMVFANAMTAVTLSAERFDSELRSGKSVVHARNTSWNAALIPQINFSLRSVWFRCRVL